MHNLATQTSGSRWSVFYWYSIGLLMGCLTSSGSLAQSGFQVYPPRLYFTEQSVGQPLRLKVINPNPNRLVLEAHCSDWKRDSLGNKQYSVAGSLPNSCCSGVRIQPTRLELEPGAEREVLVSIDTTQLRQHNRLLNGMIFMTQINERETGPSKGSGGTFFMRVQLGVHVYYMPHVLTRKQVDITQLQLASKPGRQLKVLINNGGELTMESQVRVEITNLVTNEEVKLDPIPVNTLPGDRIWLTAPLPDSVKPGKYLMVAILESGTDVPLQVAELETTVP